MNEKKGNILYEINGKTFIKIMYFWRMNNEKIWKISEPK